MTETGSVTGAGLAKSLCCLDDDDDDDDAVGGGWRCCLRFRALLSDCADGEDGEIGADGVSSAGGFGEADIRGSRFTFGELCESVEGSCGSRFTIEDP